MGEAMHRLIAKSGGLLIAALAFCVLYLVYQSNSGWDSLLWMGAGTGVALFVWHGKGIGLPLLPILAIQHFVAYGIPIIGQNPTIKDFPPDLLPKCGQEIFAFLVALSFAWRAGMERFEPKNSGAYVIKALRVDKGSAQARLGQILVVTTTLYNVAESLGVMNSVLAMLPGGGGAIISALTKASTMIGYFLMGLNIGSGQGSAPVKALFWGSLIINSVIVTASLLLSDATNLVSAVVIGLFWGSGKLPLRFLTVVLVMLTFLHLGKAEMRTRYWEGGTGSRVVTLTALPGFYSNWVDASLSALTLEKSDEKSATDRDEKSMLARVNNLQNLLFVINAVELKKIPPVDGETYTIIPPLLIPRVLWPNKPRAHEGQVMLNVHFERQSREASIGTYIAWGLVPEAYGNFGPFLGSILLGGVLGLIIAWFENLTVNKPVLSWEGLLALTIFTNLAVSFEMVASVLVTSISQAVIIISLACYPFVEHLKNLNPHEDEEPHGTQ